MVDEILAKSKPLQTLKEHTEEVLKNYEVLKGSCWLPLSTEDWETLQKACFFHDFGKANDFFQLQIRGECCPSRFNFPHSLLSIAFIPQDECSELLIKLVAFHHWRDFLSYCNVDLEVLYRSLAQYVPKICQDFGMRFELLPFFAFCKKIEKIQSYYARRLDQPLCLEKEKRFVILLGLLNRLDHASSAGITVEKQPIEKFLLIRKCLVEKTPNPWQLVKIRDCYQKQSGVVVASTGLGKTEMGLLWSGNDKTFYTLPVRTSVNAMFDRMVGYFGYENVGLLHSDAFGKLMLGILEKGETDDALIHYDTARHLSFPITVATADQIFASALKFLGFEKIYATLSYSKVIVDEIQAYSPHTVAIVVHALREIKRLGGQYIVLTATLPPIIRDHLEYDFYIEHVPDLKKHRIEVVTEEIDSQVFRLVEKHKGQKILVVCNTVEKARLLYRFLKDRFAWLQDFGSSGVSPGSDQYPIVLFHSRFTSWDKRTKEHIVLDKNFVGVLIATQVVEISLDIDFDLLLTEVAPLEVLIQRMGRVYRRYKEGGVYAPSNPNVYIFTKNPSGMGKVYEEEIISKTVGLLRRGILSEHEKLEMVDDLYSETNLRDTSYLTRFRNALSILKNFTENNRNKAQQLFREMDSVNILPHSLLESPIKNTLFLRKFGFPEGTSLKTALSELKFTDRSQKMFGYELIKDFLVPVRSWVFQKARKVEFLSSLTGNDLFREIPVLEGQYNEREGFIYGSGT